MFSGVKAVEQLYIRSSENIGSQSLFKKGFVSSVVEVSITVNYSQPKVKISGQSSTVNNNCYYWTMDLWFGQISWILIFEFWPEPNSKYLKWYSYDEENKCK